MISKSVPANLCGARRFQNLSMQDIFHISPYTPAWHWMISKCTPNKSNSNSCFYHLPHVPPKMMFDLPPYAIGVTFQKGKRLPHVHLDAHVLEVRCILLHEVANHHYTFGRVKIRFQQSVLHLFWRGKNNHTNNMTSKKRGHALRTYPLMFYECKCRYQKSEINLMKI